MLEGLSKGIPPTARKHCQPADVQGVGRCFGKHPDRCLHPILMFLGR